MCGPFFSSWKVGAMYERCSSSLMKRLLKFLSKPNLSYMKETILEAYEEYSTLSHST